MGDTGGVIEILRVLISLIILPYAEFMYLIKALKILYFART